MTTREAFYITLMLTIVLLAGMALAGVISELAAPAIQHQIASSWAQPPIK